MLKIIVLFLLISLLNGKIINKVAMSVDGQAITSLEIASLKKNFNLSDKDAIESLIKNRLEQNFIKEVDISITSFNLEQSIKQIEHSQNITRKKLKELVKKRGVSWDSYKAYLTQNLKKTIFLREYVFKNITQPTDFDLKTFYKENINDFKDFNKINIIAYASKSQHLLRMFIINPMKRVKGVITKYISIKESDINPKIFKIIDNTKVGHFTKVINFQGSFTMYYIQEKGIKELNSFLSVKNKIQSLIIRKNELNAEKNFFNKLKSNAIIKII